MPFGFPGSDTGSTRSHKYGAFYIQALKEGTLTIQAAGKDSIAGVSTQIFTVSGQVDFVFVVVNNPIVEAPPDWEDIRDGISMNPSNPLERRPPVLI